MPPQSNNADFNDILFTDNLTTESNTSDINLVPNRLDKRQVMPLITYPSMPVWISNNFYSVASNSKKCTLGFPVKKVRGHQQFDHGFLTLGSCMSTDIEGRSDGAFYLRTLDPDRPREIRIGSAGRLVYSRTGLNYAIVTLLPDSPYIL